MTRPSVNPSLVVRLYRSGRPVCMCGCGALTNVQTNGALRGQYAIWARGHHHAGSARPDYVVDENGCWIWQRKINWQGYGRVWLPEIRHLRPAHRWMYEKLVGPVPAGLQLDHLCRVRACVNPAHLEPVTPRENQLRGESPMAQNARKTHCKHGHEFTPENTRDTAKGRECKRCNTERKRKSRARKAANS